MLDQFMAINNHDSEGNPTGGSVRGTGLEIEWQDGPLGRGPDRKPPNGAFVETVIAAAKQRIEFYQQGKFACGANAEAIGHLELAMEALNRRTRNREAREVEGTHQA